MSFLDEDKFNSEKLLALKYIKERVERASTVQNILAPITPQEEYIFDVVRVDDAASEVSELSDPFAELGGNIVLSAENKQKRRLSKVEADVLVMNSFPSAHMEVQNEIAAEMGLLQPPQLDIDKIMESNSVDDEDDDSECFKQVACALEQIGLQGYKDKKKKTNDNEKSRQKPKKSKNEEQDLEGNSLSGIWRMLGKLSFGELI